MAGEWLKFESNLPEKPETLAITVAMGWDDPDLTVGKLMRLFRWFDQQTIGGNAPNVTAALLDRIIGVSGFVQAVADVGWLVISGKSISLHNFDRHNGATAKSRALTAKRVANHKSNATGNAEGNGPSVSEALPREEKRRVEKKKGAKAPMSADKLPTWMEAVVNLYHEILPELPGVRVMDKARDQALRDFWDWVLKSKRPDGTPRATNTEEALAWIRDYMNRARNNDFIMGRSHKSPGHENWVCSIEYLLSSNGMKKVIEETKDTP